MKITSVLLLSLSVLLAFGCRSALQNADRKFLKGEYSSAIESYNELINESQLSESKKKLAYYNLAESYRLSNRLVEAMPYYKKAKDLGYAPDGVKFYYAQGLKQQGKYDAAIKLFSEYAKSGSNFNMQRLARDEVKSIEAVKQLTEKHPFIEINNCSELNTEAAEYSPMFWGDNLVYTATRDTQVIYEGTGGGFSDLYSYTYNPEDSCSGSSVYFDSLINTQGLHEASPTFSKDGKTMIFVRSNSGKRKEVFQEVNLYESRWNGKAWSEPKLVPVCKPNTWDGCPALSPNGKTLYFVSNRSGGFGGLDIYRATKNFKGEWGSVRNMGGKINSRGNEMFPYVSRDGKLYFSSNGHPGIGGLDLFVAIRKKGKVTVKNMGAPFNSSADDFAITFKDKKHGAFASNRTESKGDDDIFFFEDRTPKLKPVKYFLAGTAVEKKDSTEILLSNVSLKLVTEKGQVVDETQTDKDGRFRFKPELVMGPDYTIIADKSKYLKDTTIYITADKEVEDEEIKDRPEPIVEIVLEEKVNLTKDFYEELVREGEITLNNIYYDFDDWRIRADAAKELDKLVQFMNQHPQVKIELGSHTDDRGNDKYNLKLSQKRAESAVEYLVIRGINPARLIAKGYGETQQVVYRAETEDEHQLNRRTTVALLEGDEIFDKY